MYYLRGVAAVSALCVWSGALAGQLCLAGDFDAQVQQVLDSQTLTPQHAQVTRLLNDLRTTLRRRWKDFDMILHGSLSVGIGIKGSDVDCFIRMPINNTSEHLAVVQESIKLLRQQPALYSYNITVSYGERPFFTFYHIPTQTYCDIGFGTIWDDRIGQLFSYYYNLDELFLPLGRLIKVWCTVHELSAHGTQEKLRNYPWYLLTMFYLQQKHLAPSVYELQRHSKSEIIGDWDVNYEKIPYSARNTESLYQLLGGFYKYYSQFDFKNFIVSPFAGRPIHKSEFLNMDNVPREFSVYKKNVESKNYIYPLELKSELSIQNIFQHNYNVAVQVRHEEVSRILSHIKWAAKMYEELPSDRFLAAILSPKQPGVADDNEFHDTIRKPNDSSYNNCIDMSLSDSQVQHYYQN